MTWFADLAPCTYFGPLYDSDRLVAVGWLGAGHDFTTGPTAPTVLDRLALLLQAPFERACFAGFHACDLGCQPAGTWRMSSTTVGTLVVAGGWKNLLVPVPDEALVYVAPSMIVHYVVEHGYRPPDVFCEALLRCPDMGSAAYLRELADLLPVVGADLVSRGREPGDLTADRFVHGLRAQLARLVAAPPEQGAGRRPPTSTADALASLGAAARPALPELEAAVKTFPESTALRDALDRVRAAVEP